MGELLAKFPRTPHLLCLGDKLPRGDKLLPPAEARELLKRPVVVEEKVDGANIAFSLDGEGQVRAQGRNAYLSGDCQPQFRPLWGWIKPRRDRLRDALSPGLVLFGEWCYARHTVAYSALPDWFLAFDVYEVASRRFWSSRRRDDLVRRAGLHPVPRLGEGILARPALERLLRTSRLGSEPMEGIYLRWEDDDWLGMRAKLVRAGWLGTQEEHWARRRLVRNRLQPAGAAG